MAGIRANHIIIRAFCLCAVMLCGCLAAETHPRKAAGAQDIRGRWLSTLITYPVDPVFRNTPPETAVGSAVFVFKDGSRFEFAWNETRESGTYRIAGEALVLTSDTDGTAITCPFRLTETTLTISTDDGFTFQCIRDTAAAPPKSP